MAYIYNRIQSNCVGKTTRCRIKYKYIWRRELKSVCVCALHLLGFALHITERIDKWLKLAVTYLAGG